MTDNNEDICCGPHGEIKGGTVPVKLWTKVEEVESQALTQLRNIASLPWAFKHVAVMPDVHFGRGATVGSVIAMKGAASPAAVGVDLGCGMQGVRTNLTSHDLPDSLKQLRNDVERNIPVGFNKHSSMNKYAARSKLWSVYGNLHDKVQNNDQFSKAQTQMGTLGGGNHFIEFCLDTKDNVWLMLHSGSRNIGKVLADIHISKAKKLAHNAKLPDKDLSVFLAGTKEMEAYRRDLQWAQAYARENREVMLAIYKDIVRKLFPEVEFGEEISCHHNYLVEEKHFGEDVFVTRKGAISAREGEMGIIPGSMGAKSFIVRGRGNPESFHSASHGAGRRMSRGAAKRAFTIDDLKAQTDGVECRKDQGVVDEIPGAYKDIEQVMAYQQDLVEIVAELKQILCVKG